MVAAKIRIMLDAPCVNAYRRLHFDVYRIRSWYYLISRILAKMPSLGLLAFEVSADGELLSPASFALPSLFRWIALVLASLALFAANMRIDLSPVSLPPRSS